MTNKRTEAQKARFDTYNTVELQLRGTEWVDFDHLPILGQIYAIVCKYNQLVSGISDVTELYDRIHKVHLKLIFKGVRVDLMSLTNAQAHTIRKSIDQGGRALRHIKNDKPHLFHQDLKDQAAIRDYQNTENFGNTAGGIK